MQRESKDLVGAETGWTWGPLLQCLRQAGPGALCCSAYTWTHVSSSNKIQRNYRGLKITACMCSWGKFWTKRPPKTQPPLLRGWEQKPCQEQKQGTAHAPCTQHHPWGGQSTSATLPAGPRDTSPPSPHIRNQLPLRGASKGTCYLFSLSPAAARAPIKPGLNFLSDL